MPPGSDKLPRTGPYKKRRILDDAVADYERLHGPGSAAAGGAGGSRLFAAAAAAAPKRQPAAASRLVDGLTPANIVRYRASSFRSQAAPGGVPVTAGKRGAVGNATRRRVPLTRKWR